MDNPNLTNQLLYDQNNPNSQLALNMSLGNLAPVTQIALSLSRQNSANAINSSIDFRNTVQPDLGSNPVTPSASLKGFPITQPYGNYNPGVEKFSKGINSGVDIGVPKNTPVSLPPGKWQVVDAYDQAKNGYVGDNENKGYGNSVLVRNLDTGEQLRFSHLSSVYLPSDSLKGGDPIGLSGATGNVTGPHLDVEYYNQNGKLGDFLKTSYAQDLGLGGNK